MFDDSRRKKRKEVDEKIGYINRRLWDLANAELARPIILSEMINGVLAKLPKLHWYDNLEVRQSHLFCLEQILLNLERQLIVRDHELARRDDRLRGLRECIELQSRFDRWNMYLDLQSMGALLDAYPSIFARYDDAYQIGKLRDLLDSFEVKP